MKQYKENIKVFTDGSHTPSSCKYGIHFIDLEINDVSSNFKIKPLTNQRAELYAILKAIKIINKNYEFKILEIYTDSMYSINCVTKWITKWKKNNFKTSSGENVLNLDIILKIDKYLNKYNGKIKFIHVKAHTGNNDFNSIHNDIADKLTR